MSTEKFKNKYRIKSARKENWNYSNDANYFITICVKNMIHYFGEILETQSIASLRYTEIAKIVQEYWLEIPNKHPYVILDEFIIMPNHVHGIIIINRGTNNVEDYDYKNDFGPQSKNLSSIVRGFKMAVKTYATKNNMPFEWQKGYYDRIIRNENELNRIRKYINENPYKWDTASQNYEPNIFV